MKSILLTFILFFTLHCVMGMNLMKLEKRLAGDAETSNLFESDDQNLEHGGSKSVPLVWNPSVGTMQDEKRELKQLEQFNAEMEADLKKGNEAASSPLGDGLIATVATSMVPKEINVLPFLVDEGDARFQKQVDERIQSKIAAIKDESKRNSVDDDNSQIAAITNESRYNHDDTAVVEQNNDCECGDEIKHDAKSKGDDQNQGDISDKGEEENPESNENEKVNGENKKEVASDGRSTECHKNSHKSKKSSNPKADHKFEAGRIEENEDLGKDSSKTSEIDEKHKNQLKDGDKETELDEESKAKLDSDNVKDIEAAKNNDQQEENVREDRVEKAIATDAKTVGDENEEKPAQEGQPEDGSDDIDLGLLDIVQTIHALRKRDALYDKFFGASNVRGKRSSIADMNTRRENYIKDLEDSFPNPNTGSDSLEPHVRVKRLHLPKPNLNTKV